MPTLTTTEARRRLAEVFNRAHYAHERTLVTRNGEPVAAIVSVDELEAMEALEDLMDIRAAHESLRDAEAHGGILDIEQYFASLED